MDVRGFAHAFSILISLFPRKLSKEFTTTVKGVEVAIHINGLRVKLKQPLHPFGMQFFMKEILTSA